MMEITSIQSGMDVSRIPLEQLTSNKAVSEVEKLKEAARQFESILLRQILKDAQKTVIKSDFSDDSVSGGIYRDMVTSTLADAISKAGTFGFAESLESELTRQAMGDQRELEN